MLAQELTGSSCCLFFVAIDFIAHGIHYPKKNNEQNKQNSSSPWPLLCSQTKTTNMQSDTHAET